MEQNKIFILIIVIFLLTTPILSTFKNIIKYNIYLFLILSAISYLNKDISKNIKDYIINFINFDESIITKIFSFFATYVYSFINSFIENNIEKKNYFSKNYSSE